MKLGRIIGFLAVALLTVTLVAPAAMAQGPAGTWVSGIQVQNQSETETATNVTIDFYWAANSGSPGLKAYTHTIASIPPGESVQLYVPSIAGLPDDFVGSAVVSSDVPVAAIILTANTGVAGTQSEPIRVGGATGVLSPSDTVYAPYLRKNYYNRNTYIAVQNTSDGAADVAISFRDHTGATLGSAQRTENVPGHSTYIFYLLENSDLPDNFHGSATISSSVPLAAIVNNYDQSTSAVDSGFESFNGFAPSTATKLFLPKLSVNYHGYQSGISIQNVGSAAATMTIRYKFGGQTFTKTSPSIQPGASWEAYLAAEAQSGIPAGFAGSGAAEVTSSQPIVGVVTEVHWDLGHNFVYSAVAEGEGTATLLFPKYDHVYYNYNGGIQVQNVDASQSTVLTAVFSQAGTNDVVVVSPSIAPGASWNLYAPLVRDSSTGNPLVAGFHGSVTVTSNNGVAIAGIYTSRDEVGMGDSVNAYNAIQK